jgi:hypothetical protein
MVWDQICIIGIHKIDRFSGLRFVVYKITTSQWGILGPTTHITRYNRIKQGMPLWYMVCIAAVLFIQNSTKNSSSYIIGDENLLRTKTPFFENCARNTITYAYNLTSRNLWDDGPDSIELQGKIKRSERFKALWGWVARVRGSDQDRMICRKHL